METRTYYFPSNQIGRYVLNCLVERVACSIGEIRHVGESLAVPITTPAKDVLKIERILRMYDLM